MCNDEKIAPATGISVDVFNGVIGELVSIVETSCTAPLDIFEVDPAYCGSGGADVAPPGVTIPPATHSNMPSQALASHRQQVGLRTGR